MSYPLRLPPNLEAAARERAAGIGISFNAFLCVCVDAYVNGAAKPAIEARAPRAASQREQLKDRRNEAEFQSIADELDENGQSGEDSTDWRFFDPDPELWPFVDPDPQWAKRRDEILERYGDAVETGTKALEREYWATRQRPAYEQPGTQGQSAPKKHRSKQRTGRD
ncbi:hypothetical protein [Acidovorax sp. 69]|uniref:hypothetical protein n=1 Tax=Acidovorax sp. 69 TaxID=2035202 RepID=UPI001E5D52A5|nr:hypothetical protein [Acidovorax sp. 69]